MTRAEIENFYKDQLKNWKLARENCTALKNVEKKPMHAGGLEGFIQFNPARAVSTLAKVDENSIQTRKCFLCETNRPKEQRVIEILPGWELLVNPYPILPLHFTIASLEHIPQKLSVETGFKLAKLLKGMVVFYNDEGAGASAPDHSHFQAVPQEELPLIKYLKNNAIETLPFQVIRDVQELITLQARVNAYFWEEADTIRFAAIPRKAHRPSEYYKTGSERRAVSPGAIDMAGIIVTPVREDFNALTNQDIESIYRQVAFNNGNDR